MSELYSSFPRKSGIQGPGLKRLPWTPAFAGVTYRFIADVMFRSDTQRAISTGIFASMMM